MNFPIFNKQWEFTNNEILTYLDLFPEHIVYFSRHIDGVLTHHRFDDGLHLSILWQQNEKAVLTFPLDLMKIKSFQQLGYLKMKSFSYFAFSRSDCTSNQKTFTAFFSVFETKKRRLKEKDYFQLEHDVDTFEFPQEDFIKLHQQVDAFRRFEAYLRKQKKSDGL